MKLIIKTGWEQGVKLLLSLTLSKVVFLSTVLSVDDFLDVIDLMRDTIDKCMQLNPVLTEKLRGYLISQPYSLYSFFIDYSKPNLQAPEFKRMRDSLK